MKSIEKGIKRILNAFYYSKDGFCASFKSEEAFRQDLLVCFLGIIFLFLFDITLTDKLIMFFSLIFILLMELVNTAIEMVVDRISDDYHILSKKAKDIGSLLVLISFINAFVIWTFILFF